jgi:YesN/AraC family two-component response regulator
VNLGAAKRNRENSRKTVNEVMYDVGYADIKAFRMIFKKTAGLSPLEYKNKFNKD